MPRMGKSLWFSGETVANWVWNSIHQRAACACGYFIYHCVEGANVAADSPSELGERLFLKLFKRAYVAKDAVDLRSIATGIYQLAAEVEGVELSRSSPEAKALFKRLSVVSGASDALPTGKEQVISKVAQQVKEEIRSCSVSCKFVAEWVIKSFHQPKVCPCGHYIYQCVEGAHLEANSCIGLRERICMKIVQDPLAEEECINVGSIAKAICELIGEGEALSVNLKRSRKYRSRFCQMLSGVMGVNNWRRRQRYIGDARDIMSKLVKQLQEEFLRISNPVYVSTLKDDEKLDAEDELVRVEGEETLCVGEMDNVESSSSQGVARELDACFVIDSELLHRVFSGVEVAFRCRRYQKQSGRIGLMDARSGSICGDGYMSEWCKDSVRSLMEKSPKHKQGIERISRRPMTTVNKRMWFTSCIFQIVQVRKYPAHVVLAASSHVMHRAFAFSNEKEFFERTKDEWTVVDRCIRMVCHAATHARNSVGVNCQREWHEMASRFKELVCCLIRGLGPVYRDRVQFDLEMGCLYFPRIRSDGLRIVAGLLKKPSWIMVFVKHLEESPAAYHRADVCLHVLMQTVSDLSGTVHRQETRNLDGQGVGRFLGHAFLYRIGLIEKDPRGDLVLGSTRVKCKFVEDRRFCLAILSRYLALDFSLEDSDNYVEASEKIARQSRSVAGHSSIISYRCDTCDACRIRGACEDDDCKAQPAFHA